MTTWALLIFTASNTLMLAEFPSMELCVRNAIRIEQAEKAVPIYGFRKLHCERIDR